jgi:hypothetical protein
MAVNFAKWPRSGPRRSSAFSNLNCLFELAYQPLEISKSRSYSLKMISIADIAAAIEGARTYAPPGREASAVIDVYWQLRELNDERAKYSCLPWKSFDQRLHRARRHRGLHPSRHLRVLESR